MSQICTIRNNFKSKSLFSSSLTLLPATGIVFPSSITLAISLQLLAPALLYWPLSTLFGPCHGPLCLFGGDQFASDSVPHVEVLRSYEISRSYSVLTPPKLISKQLKTVIIPITNIHYSTAVYCNSYWEIKFSWSLPPDSKCFHKLAF